MNKETSQFIAFIIVAIFMLWVFVGDGGTPQPEPYENMTDNEKMIILDWKYEQLRKNKTY